MKKAAVYAIASMVDEKELCPEHIIVSALDKRVVPVVAKAVKQAAIDSGVIRKWDKE